MSTNEYDVELVVDLAEIGADDLPRVGGKGVNLGILAAAGLPVPSGFCATTAAFDRFMAQDPGLSGLLDALERLDPDDVQGVREHAGRLRTHLRGLPVPTEVRDAVQLAWQRAGSEHAYAVRSSATLEDLPQASFAGQQDTYLQIRGGEAIVERMRDCWASLFTDRAVLYRRQHGFPSRAARLAVVVQRMVAPDVSGILFTADPVTGHRGVCSIDASYGLGEALVSGLVDADLYRLDKKRFGTANAHGGPLTMPPGAVLEARVGAKAEAIVPLPEGGTQTRPVPPQDRARRCLSDTELAALLELALRVEQLQGCPQDLEWCIEGDELFLVQARAITSLFPLPAPAPPEGDLRVYMSFGHVQVNTAPMRPMAHDLVRWLIPFGKSGPHERSSLPASAGGRIYFDMTPALLRWPISRILPVALMNIDPGIARRLMAVRDRPGFADGRSHLAARPATLRWFGRRVVPSLLRRLVWARPERAREEFEALVEQMRREFAERFAKAPAGGPRLREAVRTLEGFFQGPMVPMQMPLIIGGMLCWGLLRRLVRGRVSDATVRALSRGLPGNVTTDMDLELGDLADRARQVPELVECLRSAPPSQAIARARELPGTEAFFADWERFMARYGHRGPGEIDVTTPRWADDSSSLVTSLVGILGDEPGSHRRRHEAAIREAEAAQAEIARAAGGGLLGWLRRPLALALVRRVRAYLGLREHAKYVATMMFMHTRKAIVEAAGMAVERGRLERVDDGFMLDFDELEAAVEDDALDVDALRREVARRRHEFERHARLVPPRVITSEGEQPVLPDDTGPLPPGELAGHAASAGVVEGVARVVLDPTRQVLEAGEILVAPFTDPGWTPLFVHAGGLVMEVGGLMTHGSVVAREYGLPAVVGVDGATTRIRSGQRVRVDGDRGRVILLDEVPAADASPEEVRA
ncbi:phosphoenolpyruvate synthase [Paraliomyxa miuraensis]|uniref:phosphoenolpyruvate synthase n=1 Tax=Paraliomyxa miuraensis TaxID=376150 RepID=UPI00225AF551|nr:phosphoenolpyruvate synthase [Paraliomyxa miuraensis]MCX4246157.1 phosphoenolpyruvate synthase [Paraliomyxa miuraensis]